MASVEIQDKSIVDIKILYKNKVFCNILNVNCWYFTKIERKQNYLLEFQDKNSDFIFECYVKNRKKVQKNLELNFINLEDIEYILN